MKGNNQVPVVIIIVLIVVVIVVIVIIVITCGFRGISKIEIFSQGIVLLNELGPYHSNNNNNNKLFVMIHKIDFKINKNSNNKNNKSNNNKNT